MKLNENNIIMTITMPDFKSNEGEFDGSHASKDASFGVEKGQLAVLLESSGSGKRRFSG